MRTPSLQLNPYLHRHLLVFSDFRFITSKMTDFRTVSHGFLNVNGRIGPYSLRLLIVSRSNDWNRFSRLEHLLSFSRKPLYFRRKGFRSGFDRNDGAAHVQGWTDIPWARRSLHRLSILFPRPRVEAIDRKGSLLLMPSNRFHRDPRVPEMPSRSSPR